MEKIISNKYIQKIVKYKEYIILLIVSIAIMWPYMSSNYIKGDDTDIHISNIYATYTQMQKGSLGFDKILPIIGNNFGYGTGIFYPCLSHITTAYMTYILKGNVILSLKIIHWIVYLISGILMYKLVNRIFKNKFVALISSIFYITFPYSITEVFSRDAIAESFVYMFMPMVILGLYELFEGNKKSFYIWFIIGYVGMINSHLVMSVYFTGLVFIYLALNIKKVFTKDNLKSLSMASIIMLLIISPFIIPILQHKSAGIYHVFESDSMSKYGTMIASTLGFDHLLVQKPLSEFPTVSCYLNLLTIALTIITCIRYKKLFIEKAEKNIVKFLLILVVVTLFLISKLCPWRFFPKIMIMLQFAWRLEAMLLLALSILASLPLRTINKSKYKIICFIIVIVFNSFTAYSAYNFTKIAERNIEEINMSYWGMGYEKEYLPEKTIENIEYFNNRKEEIIVKNGNADIEIVSNEVPELKANISNCTEDTKIELPRIYYLGYEAILIQENGAKTKLDLYMNNNGFIETSVNTSGTIQLRYRGTTLSNIANVVSTITILLILGWLILNKIKGKKQDTKLLNNGK